ncbi:MAG: FAD-dependent oxidoreductase [Eubacteriales bacterium]|nr:FAD-dependent oxidoreductase [Eubacteriales bacterium]
MKKFLAILMACMMALPCVAFAATDGSYTAEAAGFGGAVSVTLTMAGDVITDCAITGENETPAIGGEAIGTLTQQVLDAQSADIDGVSGATVTSGAVKTAVAACLAQANGVAATEAKLADGTYTAEGYGFDMAVSDKVIVTIEGGKIASIAYGENCGDTPPMLDTVEKTLFPRVIENQSVAVDSVSGATVTSGAVKTAITDCLTQALTAAGCDASAITAFQTVPEKKGGNEELSTQVLIVGMGGSGTYAALRAAESGAQVMVVEKQARYGGTTALTSEIESINPPRIKELYNGGEDFCDADAMYQAWLDYVDGDAKVELIDLFFENCGPALDWLALDHGAQFDFEPQAGFTDTDVYKVKFQWLPNKSEQNPMAPTYGYNKAEIATYFDRLVDDYTKLGGQYMLETEAYDLIVEDGKVCGVKARNLADGTEYTIRADAVILATGGFLGSAEMTEKYLSDEYYPLKGAWKIYGSYRNDGKMLQSAIDNGAATYNIGMPPEVHMSGTVDFLPAHEYGYDINVVEGSLDFNTGRECIWTVADLPLIMGVSADSLAVGMNAKRFTSETGIAMLDPWIAGPNYYSIWSSEQIDGIVADGLKTDVIGPAVGFLGHRGSIPSGVALPQAYDVLQDAIDRGYVYKADTLEELAALTGLDAATLTATVESYNGFCANGTDTEFGKDAALLTAIGKGPYYAIKMASYSYNTVAGLDINEQFQVLDGNGQVMDGLFAIGSDSAGVLFSEKKPYVTFGGANNGWALTSAYVVGGIVADYVNAK